MTNRKSYNSILFLTVYLGLVLVGGSSHVFAHAATNSLFDLRNEIEFKEDLDNKPDNDEVKYFTESFEQYLSDVEHLTKDLTTLNIEKKFNFNSERFDVKRFYSEQCNFDSNILIAVKDFGRIENQSLLSTLNNAKEEFEKYGRFSDCLPTNGFDVNGARNSQTNFKLNKQGLKFEVIFSKESAGKAKHFSEQFNLAKNFYFNNKKKLLNSKNSFSKLVYENTKISTENNQVFIVTRLPRASIDSLLK